MSDIVLNIPVNAPDVDPLLEALEKIDKTLLNINKTDPMGKFNKNIDKSNKELKKTGSNFDSIFKKIKLSGLMSGAVSGLGSLLGGAAIGTGAMIFGAMKSSNAVANQTQAESMGLDSKELLGAQRASELTFGNKDTAVNAIDAIQKALSDVSKSGEFANLGLNQESLKEMSPQEAFRQVLEAGQNADPNAQFARESFEGISGGGISWKGLTEGERDYSKEFFDALEVQMNGISFDNQAMIEADKALKNFKFMLEDTSLTLGSKFAGPLADLMEKLTPHLDKATGYLANLIDSISQEDIDNFMGALDTLFNGIGWIVDNVLAPVLGKAMEFVSAPEETVTGWGESLGNWFDEKLDGTWLGERGSGEGGSGGSANPYNRMRIENNVRVDRNGNVEQDVRINGQSARSY